MQEENKEKSKCCGAEKRINTANEHYDLEECSNCRQPFIPETPQKDFLTKWEFNEECKKVPQKECNCKTPLDWCENCPTWKEDDPSPDFITKKMEDFDEKFNGWILQDDQEFYRGFEPIKNFFRQAILEAQAEKVREITKELQNLPYGEIMKKLQDLLSKLGEK